MTVVLGGRTSTVRFRTSQRLIAQAFKGMPTGRSTMIEMLGPSPVCVDELIRQCQLSALIKIDVSSHIVSYHVATNLLILIQYLSLVIQECLQK